MNINDVSEVKETNDKLSQIFEEQTELMHKYKVIEKMPEWPLNLHSRDHQKILKDFIYRVIEELCEAGHVLKNKPWTQRDLETDVDHYKEELADALHFFVELCILSGIDAKELYSLYYRKKKVNQFRQETKY